VIVVLKLIYSSMVLSYGPKRLVSPAALWMPQPSILSVYAKITFSWRTSLHLKGNDWTEGAEPCSSDSVNEWSK